MALKKAGQLRDDENDFNAAHRLMKNESPAPVRGRVGAGVGGEL